MSNAFSEVLLYTMSALMVLSLCFSGYIIYLQLKIFGFKGDTRMILHVNLRLPHGGTRVDEMRVRDMEQAQHVLNGYILMCIISAHVFSPTENTIVYKMDSNGHLRYAEDS